MQIVFATCLAQPEISKSDQILANAFEREGVTVSGVAWNSDSGAFLEADGVIIRTTWDYFDYYPQFTEWLGFLRRQNIPVLNSIDVLQWNVHKSYLFDLLNAGLPLLPMVAVEDTVASIKAAAVDNNWSRAVLKCLVSGTARGLTLFDSNSDEQIKNALEVAKPWSEFGLVVQPFMPQIQSAGELSMVFVDGQFSHAVRKTPKSNEFRIQSEFGGRYEREQPTAQSLGAAAQYLNYVKEKFGDFPLYARVDGLIVDDTFQLMELELAEPELMFNLAPESADAMAKAAIAHWHS